MLTSGSTGDPVPHAKPWGLLVTNARSEARRLGEALGRADLAGVSLVATVPPQHMYGFESSVLIALHGGAVLDAGRPFFPADIAAALARVPAPRVLVTTPFHLKAVLDAGLALPPLALVLCATAPLAPQLAAEAEARLHAPLVEIYGCTEAGQVASRRTTAGAEWRTFDGIGLAGDGDAVTVSGGHVPQPTVLADVLEVTGSDTFRLLGRTHDLINVAGKRSSIGHLNFQLNSIDGVVDGAFWMPPDSSGDAHGIVRLVAFVVAPGLSNAQIGAALARACRRCLPAAPDRPRRGVAARGDRQADGRATRRAGGSRAARSGDERRRAQANVRGRGRPSRLRRSLSRASRCCRASPCWPKCSRRRAPSRRCRACLGASPRLAVVKFTAPARPGASLAIEFVVGAQTLAWRVDEAGRAVASGQIARADTAEVAP